MRRTLLLLSLLLAIPFATHAQGGKVTLIQSLPEPLPNCTPSMSASQRQPQVWDTTSQSMKTCTATNTWTAMGASGAAFYQTIDQDGTPQTQRPTLNLISGTNTTVTCVDNSGATRTDCTFVSSATAATAFSAITAASNTNAGTFAASGNTWNFSAATLFRLRAGTTLTTSVNGDLAYDTTNNNWHAWDNAADKLVGIWGATPTNGHCVTAQVASNVVTLLDAGAPCAAGSAASWSTITNGTNSNAGTFTASGNSWDFTGTTIFKGRVGAGLTTSANGDFGYDTTNKNWHLWTNASDLLAGVWASTPTNGHCVTAQVSSGVVTLLDAGAVCATGSTASWSAISNGTNSNAGTFTATGNTWDWTGTTIFKLRVGAGLTTSANGDIGYDTTNKNWHAWTNAADKLVGVWTAAPANGNCVSADVVANVVLLQDAGSPCGGTANWSTLTAGTNSNAGTFIASGNTWNFTATTAVLLKTGAGYAPTTSGSIGYDTTANKWVFGQNGATVNFGLTGSCVNLPITALSATAAPTCGTISNAGLVNSSTTVNGTTCTLGSTCTVSAVNTTLSNLTSPTAINQDLLCASNGSCSLGATGTRMNQGWFSGNVTVGGEVDSTNGFFLTGSNLFNFGAPGGTCSSGATFNFGLCIGDSTGGIMLWDTLSGTPRTILSLTANLVNGNLPVASSTRAQTDSGIAAASGHLTLKAGLFSALPACAGGTEGTEGAVTDSMTNTWGATITGSGSDHVLAYCDGTNWTVAGK